MGDSFAHLEKMGRELKCPICLSLVSSAISLTCNHVFCNLCITKSMKSDSHCPVCKVPFQRREVRPAPHMDNLVNIYKSMEVASGVTIFVTQTAPSTKTSEGDKNQVEGIKESAGPGTSGHVKRKRNKRKSKRGKSKQMVKPDEKASEPQLSMEPSFPAKKRVHVLRHHQFETPIKPNKSQGDLSGRAEKGPTDASTLFEEQATFAAKKDSEFVPFFWLREENDNDGDIERPSYQQLDIDRVTGTPLQNIPSFSDIKDSDDRSPTTTPNGKAFIQSKVADVFDSEMFEWTQRACSPELCSSPMKDTVDTENVLDGIPEKCEAGSQVWSTCNRDHPVPENAKYVKGEQGNEETSIKSFTSQKANNTNAQSERKKPNNRSKRNSGTKRKRVKVTGDKVLGESSLGSINESLSEGSKLMTNSVTPNTQKKRSQRNEKPNSDTITVKKVADVQSVRNGVKIQNPGIKIKSAELTDLHGDNSEGAGNLKRKTGKSMKISKYQKNDGESNKKQKVDTVVAEVLQEVPINQNQRTENMKNHNLLIPCSKAKESKISGSKKKMSNVQKKCVGQVRGNGRSKISSGDAVEGCLSDGVVYGSTMASVKINDNISGYKDPQARSAANSEPTKKVMSTVKNKFLQKCGSIPGSSCCAFCQSSIDTEASGEMMNYFNGKPVDFDFNEGSNIIHSHRNCTEWAPNVYFEGDIAINLDSELARSRRIKCSCCGIKGAALGCYDMSCRKSYHVPCAKLVPECRWDTENFVILCPLHASSKLPKENCGSQGKKQKQSIQKRASQSHQAKVIVQDGINTSWPWKGSSKWVMCCSGLTAGEKEVVSKFTRMAGISLLNTFGPSVTHIVASTDENGACKRTLKVLMGILEGKWILKIDWVKACVEAMEPVAEEDYEIRVDTHGIKGGPQLGRQLVLNKQPKLFNGFKFYFMGEFSTSYKGYLQDLVVAAGGTILHRKPIEGDSFGLPSVSTTVILYNAEVSDERGSPNKKSLCKRRQDEAQALASLNGSKVAAHSWVLDSIAACKLQSL